jgi:hypothetical protein
VDVELRALFHALQARRNHLVPGGHLTCQLRACHVRLREKAALSYYCDTNNIYNYFL